MKDQASPLLWKIAMGFLVGIILGFAFGPHIPGNVVLRDFVVPFFDAIGRIFLALLKMLIVPLVFSSLVCGAAAMGDVKKMGRVGAKVMSLYIGTTFIAVAIGMGIAHLIQPGVGMNIEGATDITAVAAQPLSEVLLGIFPANPLYALVTGNMLQIIVFALFFGVAAALAGEKGKRSVGAFQSIAEVMFSMTRIVMYFAPLGVCALIFSTASRHGADILLPFGKVIFAVYLACILHSLIVFCPIVLLSGHSPIWFFKGIRESMLTAFVTRSSAATLPVTFANCREKLGISEELTSFALPLGVTFNMDGTAIYQGVCALFVAQAFNVEMSFTAQLMVVLTATLAAIGTAGVPGSGFIMLSMVLTSVGLPIEGVALLAGIDAILDAARNTLNVTGDPAVCCLVAVSEGETLKGGRLRGSSGAA